MIKPTSDHVVIEPVREERKKGGILLPDTIEKEKSEKGEIVAVGPGKLNVDGKHIPMGVKKGDIVIFSKYGPRTMKIDDREYLIAREEDILAIIK